MDERPRVQWVGGTWRLVTAEYETAMPPDPAWLDAWLDTRGWTRADLDFGAQDALRQRFIFEFGALNH